MKKIAIIGAGGFGREVKFLIDCINGELPTFDIIGFYDDNPNLPEIVNGLKVLGRVEDLLSLKEPISVALGIGDPKVKENIVRQLSSKVLDYPQLIHPNVIMGKDNIVLGPGVVICAGNILTCDIKIGAYTTLNLGCTVGHDTEIGEYSSFMPSVNISGEVFIKSGVYVGTGAKIINQLQIGEKTTIGAGAVVSKSLPSFCTAVGIPAKPIKFQTPSPAPENINIIQVPVEVPSKKETVSFYS